jgi:hypothetical protein
MYSVCRQECVSVMQGERWVCVHHARGPWYEASLVMSNGKVRWVGNKVHVNHNTS